MSELAASGFWPSEDFVTACSIFHTSSSDCNRLTTPSRDASHSKPVEVEN